MSNPEQQDKLEARREMIDLLTKALAQTGFTTEQLAEQLADLTNRTNQEPADG